MNELIIGKAMVRVGFYCKHLCTRATTVALYDYACANEDVSHNTSIIYTLTNHPFTSRAVVDKFKLRFQVIECENFAEVDRQLIESKVDYLYLPHGQYACVLSQTAVEHGGVWLPHIVNALPVPADGGPRPLLTTAIST